MIQPLESHRIWKLGNNVDTDALAPGHAMKHSLERLATHCLEGLRPDFAPKVRPGDVLVAGSGFGIGSSREQAASVLVHLGVKAVIAPSYSGLYFRNAFNVGLLLITCPLAEQLHEGEAVQLDLAGSCVVNAQGSQLTCEAIPDFLLEMVQCGGLMNQLRQRIFKKSYLGVQL